MSAARTLPNNWKRWRASEREAFRLGREAAFEGGLSLEEQFWTHTEKLAFQIGKSCRGWDPPLNIVAAFHAGVALGSKQGAAEALVRHYQNRDPSYEMVSAYG